MGISNLYEFDFPISHTITNYFCGEWWEINRGLGGEREAAGGGVVIGS
jgi:hypothetical protein